MAPEPSKLLYRDGRRDIVPEAEIDPRSMNSPGSTRFFRNAPPVSLGYRRCHVT